MQDLAILFFISRTPTSTLFIPSLRLGARDTKRTLGESRVGNSDLDPDSKKPVNQCYPYRDRRKPRSSVDLKEASDSAWSQD